MDMKFIKLMNIILQKYVINVVMNWNDLSSRVCKGKRSSIMGIVALHKRKM